MSEILLVKQTSLDGFSEAEREAVRRFLFGLVDGQGKDGKKLWRRWWRIITEAEPGEMFRWAFKRDRSGPHHRRTMKLLNVVFDAQDRFEHFEMFLSWVKVGAGHVEWAPGPKGGIVPLPKSISYAAADQDEFTEFAANAEAFLRGEHAPRFLWRHLKQEQADQMMAALLEGFEG
jgi:hypothetical protein